MGALKSTPSRAPPAGAVAFSFPPDTTRLSCLFATVITVFKLNCCLFPQCNFGAAVVIGSWQQWDHTEVGT